jgi:5-methylcytosine-specific restriction endonuclease McrA
MKKLKDEKWKAFRWFVMKVRGEKCETCGSTENLQVHHLKYKKVKAWEYTCNDVIVVCRDCHKRLHGINV